MMQNPLQIEPRQEKRGNRQAHDQTNGRGEPPTPPFAVELSEENFDFPPEHPSLIDGNLHVVGGKFK